MENKRTILRAVLILINIACIVLAFFAYDNLAAQLMIIIPVAILLALTFFCNLEKGGMRTVLLTAATPLASICKFLTKTQAAKWLANVYTDLFRAVVAVFDPAAKPTVGEEKALIISFWLAFAVIAAVSKVLDSPTIQKRFGNDKKVFKEKTYNKQLEDFCLELRQRIVSINKATNWNEKLFTPLDTEVEINKNGKKRREHKDLLKCLKRTNHGKGIFLVLGDPGSGKSVALRKLCLDLLNETKRSKIVPVYVNLRDWKTWDEEHLPTKKDLLTFLEDTLRKDGDFSTDVFLDTYFKGMLENGRFYFVFDSFDEIPCLLGAKDCDAVIEHISELLCQFLTGPNQIGGVVASRQFHSPKDDLEATYRITIKPLSIRKIHEMFQKYLPGSSARVKEMCKTREDLVQISKNPFMLSLLIEYFRNHRDSLPNIQMEIFDEYINKRLEKCKETIQKNSLTIDTVLEAAKKLAAYMSSSQNQGLDYPIDCLCNQSFDEDYWKRVLGILENIKICKISSTTFSFVHRRFQEFFIVKGFLSENKEFSQKDYQCILDCNGLRDAFVLYCEIADVDKSKAIAQYCCDKIKANLQYRNMIGSCGCRQLINTILFVGEAFRNRRDAIAPVEDDLKHLFAACVKDRTATHYAVAYSISKSLSIFDDDFIQEMILALFSFNSSSFDSNMVEACRHIQKKARTEIEAEFIALFSLIPYQEYFRSFKDYRFVLSLSKKYLAKTSLYHLSLLPLHVFHSGIYAIIVILNAAFFFWGAITHNLYNYQINLPTKTFYVRAALFAVLLVAIHCGVGNWAFGSSAIIRRLPFWLKEKQDIFPFSYSNKGQINHKTLWKVTNLLDLFVVPLFSHNDNMSRVMMWAFVFPFFSTTIFLEFCYIPIVLIIVDALYLLALLIPAILSFSTVLPQALKKISQYKFVKNEINDKVTLSEMAAIFGIFMVVAFLIIIVVLCIKKSTLVLTIIYVIGIPIFLFSIVFSIHRFHLLYRNRKIIQSNLGFPSISREQVIEVINTVKNTNLENIFLEKLVLEKPELTGEWPLNINEEYAGETLELLTKLDCIALKISTNF